MAPSRSPALFLLCNTQGFLKTGSLGESDRGWGSKGSTVRPSNMIDPVKPNEKLTEDIFDNLETDSKMWL